MLNTDAFRILDSSNAPASGGVVETVKAAKPSVRNVNRRKLADISNLQHNIPRPLVQNVNPQSFPKSPDENFKKLQKEKEGLVKLLEQRNKIIEQSRVKIEHLRAGMTKLQEQNKQLALSHTHMLAELNSGRDRLKVLQHELCCKSALLNLRRPETEGNDAVRPLQREDAELLGQGETSTEAGHEEKPDNIKRKGRSLGLASSASLQSKLTDVNRTTVRRQSARLKPKELKPVDDMHILDAKADETPLCNELENLSSIDRKESKPVGTKRRQPSKSLCSSKPVNSRTNDANKRSSLRRQSLRLTFAADAENSEESCDLGDDSLLLSECSSSRDEQVIMEESTSISQNLGEQKTVGGVESLEFTRPSMSRPSRVAAKKVQTYKEIPLNVKMRRPE